MDFKVGDSVVYPNHGVALVENILELSFAGNSSSCYQLRIVNNNTLVVVPLQNVHNVGLRRTVARREVSDLLAHLSSGESSSNADWKDRFKENSNRMRSGRLSDVAGVLHSLSRLGSSRTLSFREKLMLEKARELVISEVAAVYGISPDQASQMVDQALQGGRAA